MSTTDRIRSLITETYRSVLFEGKLDDLRRKYNHIEQDVWDYLMGLTQNPKSKPEKHLQWLVAAYDTEEDQDPQKALERIETAFKLFLEKQPKLQQKDLYGYKTLEDLEKAVNQSIGRRSINLPQGVTKFFEDDEWVIGIPSTEQQSCEMGKGTEWCIAATKFNNYFDSYSQHSIFYIMLSKTRKSSDLYYKMAVQYKWEQNKIIPWDTSDNDNGRYTIDLQQWTEIVGEKYAKLIVDDTHTRLLSMKADEIEDLEKIFLNKTVDRLKTKLPFASFNKLEQIQGDALITGAKIQDLDNLSKVGGTLTLAECHDLTHISSLKEVKTLKLYRCNNLTKIPADLKVEHLVLEECSKLTLGTVPTTLVSLSINKCNSITDMSGLTTIQEDISIQDSERISSLGSIASFEGSLKLRALPSLQQLPSVSKVKNIEIQDCDKLTTLGAIRVVDGDAKLQQSHIADLGELKTVSGSAQFPTTLTSLGKLHSVGTIDISKSSITVLANLEAVKNFENGLPKSIENLGSLKFYDGMLELPYKNYPKLVSLGALEGIGGNLDLTGHSKLTSLGNVRIVNGWLLLSGAGIQDASNLKQVGGKIKISSNIPEAIFDHVEKWGGITVED